MPGDGNCLWHAFTQVLLLNGRNVKVSALKKVYREHASHHLANHIPGFYRDAQVLSDKIAAVSAEHPTPDNYGDAEVIYVLTQHYRISVLASDNASGMTYLFGEFESDLPHLLIANNHAYLKKSGADVPLSDELADYPKWVDEHTSTTYPPAGTTPDTGGLPDVPDFPPEESEPSLSNSPADILKLVSAWFTTTGKRYAAFASVLTCPIVAALTGVYNVVRSMTNSKCSWMDVMVNINLFTVSIMSLFKIVWKVEATATVVAAVVAASRRLFGLRYDAGPNGPRPGYMIALKAASLILATSFATAGVTGVLHKVTSAFSFATVTGEFATDITRLVSGWLGYDLDGSMLTNKLVRENAEKALAILASSNEKWTGDELNRIQKFSADMKVFVQNHKPRTDGVTLNAFQKSLTQIDDRLGAIAMERDSRSRRPAPVGLYLWSAQGGLGKTEYVRYLAKLLSKKIEGYNDNVYSVQPAAAHFSDYYGEHTMHYDEVGAIKNSDAKNSPFAKVNDIISGNSVPMPTASLSGKNQVPKPYVVILTSNTSFDHIDTGLTAAAKAALGTRMHIYEFCDKKFTTNRQDYRMNQPHRQPDFSHITFVQDKAEFTVDQMANKICMGLSRSFTNFSKGKDTELEGIEPFKISGKPLSLPKFNAAADHKYLHYVTGKQGCGKSTQVLPMFEDVAGMLGLPIYKPDKREEIADLIDKKAGLVVLDDLYDFQNPDQQQFFLQDYNLLPAYTKILVLSNYGPRRYFFDFSHDYTVIQTVHQGLQRRLGFDGSKEAMVLYKNATGLADKEGVAYTSADIVATWQGFEKGAFWPKVIETLPEPLPFTSKQADIWYVTPHNPKPCDVAAKLMNCCSTRCMSLAIKYRNSTPDGASLPDYLRNLACLMAKTVDNPKVYVNIAGKVYYFDGSKLYIGFDAAAIVVLNQETLEVEIPTLVAKADPLVFIPSEELVRAIRMKDSTGQNPQQFYWISREANRDTDYWRRLTARYPTTTKEFCKELKIRMAYHTTRIWEYVKTHPMMAIILAILGTVIPILLWSRLRTVDVDVPMSNDGRLRCGRCQVQSGYLVGDDYCDYFCSQKGKNKGRGGKMRHRMSSFVNIGGKRLKISETEGGPLDPVLHDVKLLCAQKGFHKNHFRDETEIRGERYTYGYDYNSSGKLEYHIEHTGGRLYSGDGGGRSPSRGQGLATGEGGDFLSGRDEYYDSAPDFQSNIVRVVGEEGRLYGLMLTPEVIRFPLHVMHSGDGEVTVVKGSDIYQVEVIQRFHGRDTAYGILRRNGELASIPGAKVLTNSLISDIQLPKVQHVIAHDPQGKSCARLPFQYVSQLDAPVVDGENVIEGRAGVCHYGSTMLEFLGPGNCGALITTKINQKHIIVGTYSVCSPWNSHYIFPVATVQEWNIVAKQIKDVFCSSSPALQKVDFFLSPQTKSRRIVYTDPRLVPRLGPIVEETYTIAGGLTTVAGVPSNRIPMDQVTKKTEVFNLAFEPVFGNLKAPVPSKKFIEEKYPDKIPPDLHGNRYLQNIRLSKAEYNIGGEDSPGNHLKSRMFEAAADLGKYWRVQTNHPDFKPLSVEEAIWGNGLIQPMNLDTSTGAAFQMLNPGVTKKSALFGERGVFIGEAGTYVKEMVDIQWDCWKKGEEFMLPTSYTLKAETRPHDTIFKKRVVNVSDPITVVNMRRVMQPLQQLFAALKAESPFQLCMNPLVDFHHTATKLLNFPYHYGLDVSSCDLTLPEVLLGSVRVFFNNVIDAGDVLRNILTGIMSNVQSCPSLCGEAFLTRDSGVPSGISGTSLIDSASMMMLVYGAYNAYNGWTYTNPENYYLDHWTYSTGDDTSFSSKYPEFTGQDIADFARDVLLMKITGAAKDGSAIRAVPLEELSYTSRTYTKLPNMGVWTGRLKEESLSGMLCWSNTTDRTEVEALLSQAIPEICIYPPEVYERFVAVVKRLGLSLKLPRYGFVHEELRDRILFATPELLYSEGFQFSTEALLSELPVEKAVHLVRADFKSQQKDKPKQPTMDTTPRTLARRWREKALAAESVEELIDSDVSEAFNQVRVDVRENEIKYCGKCYVIPSQYGSPLFWQQFSKAISNRQVQAWINGLHTCKEPGDSTAHYRNVHRYWMMSDAYNEIETWGNLRALQRILREDQVKFCSERLVASNVAQPPNVETAPAAAMGRSDAMPAGVGADTLPGEAISDAVDFHPTTGAAKPSIMMQRMGGVDMTMAPQTAVDFNLLTLAGTKIFSKIVTVQTGVAQGVKIFEFDINPWNAEILNPHTLAWALLHRRFYGDIEVHLQLVSAATIIGNLKIAFIPALYANTMTFTQANLDAFNPVEFACNVNGEGTIPCPMTAEDVALTGVYRNSTQENFGKLVCIAATAIENSYTATVDVQIKIALSLGENAIYSLPTTLSGDTENPDIGRAFDLGLGFINPTLVVDGKHEDGINYQPDNPPTSYMIGGELDPDGNLETVPYMHSTDKVTQFAGDRAVDVVEGPQEPFNAMNIAQLSGASYPNEGFTSSSHEVELTARFTEDNVVTYSNLTVINQGNEVGSYTGGTVAPVGYLLQPEFARIQIQTGTQALANPNGTWQTNNLWRQDGSEVGDVNPAGGSDPGTINFPSVVYRTKTQIQLSGIAIANNSSTQGDLAPVSVYNAKVASSAGIVPTVAAGLLGHTVPATTAHVTAVMSVAEVLQNSNMNSIVTTLTTDDGIMVAQVLRNTRGMFIAIAGLPIYANCIYPLDELNQTHAAFTKEFPLVIHSNPTAFVNRAVSLVSTARVGSRSYTGIVDADTLLRCATHVKKPNMAKKPPRRRDYFHASAVLGAAAGAAGSVSSSAIGGLLGVARTAMNNQQSGANLRAQGRIDKQLQANLLAFQNKALLREYDFKRTYMNQSFLGGNRPIGKKF